MSLPDDLASRDWRVFETDAASHWSALRRAAGPRATVDVGEALRNHARRVRPDWPTCEQREDDLAHHRELISILDRVPRRGR